MTTTSFRKYVVRRRYGIRRRFKVMLIRAMTEGTTPTSSDLGPRTLAAIEIVALEHPEATAAHISAAYDAFALEHA